MPSGRASVLVTARDCTIPFLADYPEIALSLFTDDETLNLFRSVLGKFAELPAKRLFERLGHLPIGIAVAAGMIKHDVRHTVESLADSLPPLDKLAHADRNVGRLLREAIASVGESGRNQLLAIAACAPGGTRLPFSAEIAGLSLLVALDALQELYTHSLVIEIDRPAQRYRLHPLIRDAAAPSAEVHNKHAAGATFEESSAG